MPSVSSSPTPNTSQIPSGPVRVQPTSSPVQQSSSVQNLPRSSSLSQQIPQSPEVGQDIDSAFQGQPQVRSQPELARSSGIPKPINAQQALSQINEILTGDLGDEYVTTNEEVDQVLGVLDRLPPNEYAKTIAGLNQNGQLETLTTNLEDGMRQRRFLDQAVAKGMMDYPMGGSGSRDPLGYPPEPRIYSNDGDLPLPMREVIQTQNVATAEKYTQQYNRYIDNYVAKVESASSGAEIRALGKPKEPAAISPRVSPDGISSAKRDQWVVEFGKETLGSGSFPAYKAIGQKVYHLQGLTPPGTISFKAEFEAFFDLGDGFKIGVSGSGSVRTDGIIESEQELKGGYGTDDPDLPEELNDIQLSYNQDGEVKGEYTVKPPGVELTGEVSGDGIDIPKGKITLNQETLPSVLGEKPKGSKEPGPNLSVEVEKVTTQNLGTEDVERYKVTLSKDIGGGIEVSSSSDGVDFGMGVKGEQDVEVLGREVGVEAGFSVNYTGLSPERAEYVLRKPDGFFDLPKEMQEGKRWEDLDASAQKRFQGDAWTATEWNQFVAQLPR